MTAQDRKPGDESADAVALAPTTSDYAASLRDLIDVLPLDSVEYAFAYGSGAIAQADENRDTKTVDFILASCDPHAFHRSNLERNRHHYSLLRWVGATNLSVLQTNFAAHLYYNTLIPSLDGRRTFKYGVISVDDLRTDLLDWRWLYAAGRLHKPVLDIIRPSEGTEPDVGTAHLNASPSGGESVTGLRHAILENRRSALQVALLLLPDTFTYDQLFQCIVGLSYRGDFRMTFGEDRDKIKKIVAGAADELRQLYAPLLAEDARVLVSTDGARVEQDSSSPAVYHRLNLLPSTVLDNMYRSYRLIDPRARDIEEVIFSLAHRHDVAQRIESSVHEIVRSSAWRQTFVNALSAGLTKSLRYSSLKLLKMFRSLR